MKYREFGNTAIRVSILGFGAMRLPVLDGGGKIAHGVTDAGR